MKVRSESFVRLVYPFLYDGELFAARHVRKEPVSRDGSTGDGALHGVAGDVEPTVRVAWRDADGGLATTALRRDQPGDDQRACACNPPPRSRSHGALPHTS